MENTEKTETDVLPRIMKALTTARTQLETLKQQAHEPIAIIGMACRFPGADSPEAFWALLANGEDRIAEIPIQRWDMDTYYDPVPATPGKSYVRTGAFVDSVDQFDAQFFGISPREAMLLDPQQRLLLEVTWEALERAGQSPLALKNSQTGVFVGVSSSEYTTLMSVEDQFDAYSSTGNGALFAAGRLSYVLGLQGPNFAIDTACSASLIGVHQACESLRNGTSQLAIAGGVHLTLAPQGYIVMAQMQALAPDGRSKTFDAAANGYGRGEGCGIVILKRLSAAQQDGDPILALIRGSATNHDGPSSGLTVPSATAQTKLIRAALAAGQVAANEVLYVEAHGTGTPLGDPIEIRALDAVFGQRTNPLLVGSVKTNFGHLEEAAGVAGLIKVVLAMQHNQIPRHLHCHNPNPYIDWDRTSIRVTTEPTAWPAGKKIAGVSSFGMSGSNAHVILEQAPAVAGALSQAERPYHLLTLSAKSAPALRDLATRYGAFLQTTSAPALGNVCYSAYTGRSHFAHRLSVTAASNTQMAERLVAYANGVVEIGVNQSEGLNPQVAPKVAFLFTGQGSQYIQMGSELYQTQPVFRAVLDRCEAVAQACLGRSLLELLYPATPPTHNDLLESHPCGQAANFAIECALADLWQSWGIQPDLVLGHSLGDFAAAYTAGVLTLEEGLRLVSARGRLMETARGSMLSVIASEAEMLPFLKNVNDVTIGVINGTKSVVLSGGQHRVALLAEQLQQAGFKTRLLAIPVAAHSPLLDPVLADFEAVVHTVALSAPHCAVVSSMTGALVTHELTDPTYWRRHLRNTVRFADSIHTLQQQGVTLFLEIGPKPTLVGLAGQILDEITAQNPDNSASSASFLMLPSLRDAYSDWQQMLETLGTLYVRGLNIDWVAFDKEYPRHKVTVPTYPFQRQRFWVDVLKKKRSTLLRPLIDKIVKLPFHQEILFETELSTEQYPFLLDYRIYGHVVASGATLLTLLLSAVEVWQQYDKQSAQQTTVENFVLEDVRFSRALVVPADQAPTVQAVFTSVATNDRASRHIFKLFSFDTQTTMGEPPIHVTGSLENGARERKRVINLKELQQRCIEPIDVVSIYKKAADSQLDLGPSFYWVADLWHGTEDRQEVLGRFRLPEAVSDLTSYQLHPGLLAACFQMATAVNSNAEGESLYWVVSIQTLQLYQTARGNEWWCHAQQRSDQRWDITLLDAQSEVLALFLGVELQSPRSSTIDSSLTVLEANPARGSKVAEILPPLRFRQQLNQASPEKREQLLGQEVRRIAAKILGLQWPEQIDPLQGFMDLGMDSIMAVRLSNQLMFQLEEQLPVTLAFDYPTTAALTKYLMQAILPTDAFDVPSVTVETQIFDGNGQSSTLDISPPDSEDALLKFMAQKFNEYISP